MQTGAQAKAHRKACDEGKALGNPKAAHCHCTLHSLVRLPLLPAAAIFELCLWVSAFLWAQVNTERAAHIITLAERLPGIGWYFGKQSNVSAHPRAVASRGEAGCSQGGCDGNC